MALGSIYPVTEMSTRDISWREGWQSCHFHLPIVYKFWEPKIFGALMACPGQWLDSFMDCLFNVPDFCLWLSLFENSATLAWRFQGTHGRQMQMAVELTDEIWGSDSEICQSARLSWYTDILIGEKMTIFMNFLRLIRGSKIHSTLLLKIFGPEDGCRKLRRPSVAKC